MYVYVYICVWYAYTHTHTIKWLACLCKTVGHYIISALYCLQQRFSIPVLAPPRSAYFVCYSYRFRCLFYSNVSALRSGHHRIFRHDSSSKRTYIFHSKCIEVCKTWIKIVYIYRGIWCHTRPCVKTLCSANPLMNVPKWRTGIENLWFTAYRILVTFYFINHIYGHLVLSR